ncbi:hypothetical protein [Heyndrickxia sp. FSL W8-0423]|uniref:hypothetical protein n=1 Tax=Heyndrickxia sp. FSL W8-0423 TaxID=2921601 RepID=UPI0030FB8B38
MKVYVVMADKELMSVCKDQQTAEWERNLCEKEGHKNVEIKECGVVSYDKEFYERNMDAIIHNKFPLIREFAKAFLKEEK